MRFLSDLAGTLLNSFRIGLNRLISAAGVITARNKDDTEDVAVRAREFHIRDPNSGFVYRVTVPANSPAYLSGDLDFVLPPDNGSSNQALLTDGAGNTYWGSVATGSNAMKSQEEVITPASGTSTSVFIPPQGAIIHRVVVGVETAFDGAPTIQIGVTGQTARYMQSTQNELDVISQIWENQPMYKEDDATPSNREVLITFAAGGATVGSARVVVTYSNPD